MWNNNEVTRRLNIKYPIIQAGMAGGPTTPELVAAVSNAGGLGTLGAGYMTADQMKKSIKKIKRLTEKPFGVNLFVPQHADRNTEKVEASNRLLWPIRQTLHLMTPSVEIKSENEQFEQQIQVIIDEKIPVCTFTFGVPERKMLHQLKHQHIITIGTATTVREAEICENLGFDMVVVQGSEAGGHRGSFAVPYEQAMIGTISLVPQTVDHVSIPVIAAGGIMDGRGVLAALVLGAEAVQMGTAFVTCDECGAQKLHKESILNSSEDETTVTSAFSGKPARGIRNQFIDSLKPYEKSLPDYPVQNALTKDIRSEAAKNHRPEWMSMWSGQSTRLSKKGSASQLIHSIVAEIEDFDLHL